MTTPAPWHDDETDLWVHEGGKFVGLSQHAGWERLSYPPMIKGGPRAVANYLARTEETTPNE